MSRFGLSHVFKTTKEERQREAEIKLGLVKCPECQRLTTPKELAMFNGFCEDCREEQEGDYE